MGVGKTMEKIINLSQTVYELSQNFSDIPEILFELGFSDIVKPGMITTVGRFVSLKQGASLRKISLDVVVEALTKKGYTVKEDGK